MLYKLKEPPFYREKMSSEACMCLPLTKPLARTEGKRLILPDMVNTKKWRFFHCAIHLADFQTYATISALCFSDSCTSHEAIPYLHRTCGTRSQYRLFLPARSDLSVSHGHFVVADWKLLCKHIHLRSKIG